MKREPRTIPPARSRYPRERAAGDYVDARRHTRALVYRNARRPEHDRWESNNAYSHTSGGGIRSGDKIFSKQSAAHNLLPDHRRPQSLHQLHQPAGKNHPAKQA
jgi:hypothetical protein